MNTISCALCGSKQVVKNGLSRHGHQRFLCQACQRTFGHRDHRRVDQTKRESALKHYAEGVGLRATERLLGVSHNSVMNWVKEEVAGKALAKVDACEVSYIEADELWTYVGKKNSATGCGGLLIVLPNELSAGHWAIVQPKQPKNWVRRFLKALHSLTPPTFGIPMVKSSHRSSINEAKPIPTPLKA